MKSVRLALGHETFDRMQPTVTFDAYAETFLQRVRSIRKHSTWADYRKILDHDLGATNPVCVWPGVV